MTCRIQALRGNKHKVLSPIILAGCKSAESLSHLAKRMPARKTVALNTVAAYILESCYPRHTMRKAKQYAVRVPVNSTHLLLARVCVCKPIIQGMEIYLDNAATTKPCAEAIEALTSALTEEYGNASSAHARGEGAKKLLRKSRSVIAEALGVEPAEIYFTSGATEANNLAIRGAAEARGKHAGAVVTSELEHPSVTRSVRGLRRAGWTTKHIPAVGGAFDMDALEQVLASPVQLVSVMQVQNELGYLFPIAEIAQLVHQYAPQALIHSDATQAFGKLEVNPVSMGVDLLSVASHKLCGPKGIGALYVKKDTHMFTTAFGGGQERGLRSGTEPVFLAAGFAAAVQVAMEARAAHYAHVSALRNQLLDGITHYFPQAIVHSRYDGSPYIVSFALPGFDNRVILKHLSNQGIYISHASACTFNRHNVKGEWREKHPLSMQAAGISEEVAASTLRVSFAASNTAEEIEALIAALVACTHTGRLQ